MTAEATPNAMPPDETGVVVVGSGVAGLAAAIEAAEHGARVLVLEAAGEIGGASVMSGAACCLVDTPLQRAQGIEDSIELALADWTAMGGPTADLAWAERYLADSGPEVGRWLSDLGIEWESIGQPEGNSVPRWHLPVGWGRRIVEVLADRAGQLGVLVLTGCPVRQVDVTQGRVTGVSVESERGRTAIRAGAVVLATGGYVADLTKVLRHAPQLRGLPRLLAGGSPTALGSGHDLLDRIGARFTHRENIWVYPTGTPDPRDATHQRGLGLRGVSTELWLNARGERFHDESLRGGHAGTTALLAQPDATCWCVFPADELDDVLLIDNEHYGTPAGPDAQAMKEFWEESEYAHVVSGVEELARVTGLPEQAARRSIDAFNEAVRSGAGLDPATGRSLTGLREVHGPLAAVRFFPMAQKNFGGVATDEDCVVVAGDGGRVEGLYAVGELAGMAGGSINGAAALEGTMFGPCVWSGRIAGSAAGAAVTEAV